MHFVGSTPSRSNRGNVLYNVRLKQWMYLQADGRSMVNRATINKSGVRSSAGHGIFPSGVMDEGTENYTSFTINRRKLHRLLTLGMSI